MAIPHILLLVPTTAFQVQEEACVAVEESSHVLGLATPTYSLFSTACSSLVTMGLEGVGRRYTVRRPFPTFKYCFQHAICHNNKKNFSMSKMYRRACGSA